MAGSHAWRGFPSDKFKAESHPDNITIQFLLCKEKFVSIKT